jgi:hypothetical protein
VEPPSFSWKPPICISVVRYVRLYQGLEFRFVESSGRRWYFRRNKIPKTKKATSAVPPIAPPTIAPRLFEWGIAGLLLGTAGVDVDATIEVLKVVAADWLLVFVVGGGWEVLDGELVDPPVPVVLVMDDLDDVEAVVAGVGGLEVTGVDVAEVVVMSENVWAATLFWEVKVTPTGSSTPDPSIAYARFAWQATGKVVWLGSSLI